MEKGVWVVGGGIGNAGGRGFGDKNGVAAAVG